MKKSGWLTISIIIGFSISSPIYAKLCTKVNKNQLRCVIKNINQCSQITNLPYAQQLYCRAAFNSAQSAKTMVSSTLGVQPVSARFVFFQTLPKDQQAQTKNPCLEAAAPYKGIANVGKPLCKLIAYATSVAPNDLNNVKGLPESKQLRNFPKYFTSLYSLQGRFASGSRFDDMVKNLGSNGKSLFVSAYQGNLNKPYYPTDNAKANTNYFGVSGGGGAGWGAEIKVKIPGNQQMSTLLAFGGGGGGGMTSPETSNPIVQRPGHLLGVTAVGAGGGGGMQFANAYYFHGHCLNGLGLGAGSGSDNNKVQYSYYHAVGHCEANSQLSASANNSVEKQFQQQLAHLKEKLKNQYFNKGYQINVTGGGGMGGGAEYLQANSEEFKPHALSTQAGFSFSYIFQQAKTTAVNSVKPDSPKFYKNLGHYYQLANQVALKACHNNYSDYSQCMCPISHAVVIGLVSKELGKASLIPAWMQQSYCQQDVSSFDTEQASQEGLTPYQQMLFNSITSNSVKEALLAVGESDELGNNLLEYFDYQNTAQPDPDASQDK